MITLCEISGMRELCRSDLRRDKRSYADAKSTVKRHLVWIASLTTGINEKGNIGVRAKVKLTLISSRSTESYEKYQNNQQ